MTDIEIKKMVDNLDVEVRELLIQLIIKLLPTKYFFTRELFFIEDDPEDDDNMNGQFVVNENPRYYFADSWCCDDGRITSPYYDITSIDMLLDRMFKIAYPPNTISKLYGAGLLQKNQFHLYVFEIFGNQFRAIIKHILSEILTKGDDREELLDIDYYYRYVEEEQLDLELFPE
jgi:hypothetical protein